MRLFWHIVSTLATPAILLGLTVSVSAIADIYMVVVVATRVGEPLFPGMLAIPVDRAVLAFFLGLTIGISALAIRRHALRKLVSP